MRSAQFGDLTERRVVVAYRRFGRTCPSYLQGSSRMPGSLRYAVCTGNGVVGDWMKSSEDKTSPCFTSFRIGNASEKYLRV